MCFGLGYKDGKIKNPEDVDEKGYCLTHEGTIF